MKTVCLRLTTALGLAAFMALTLFTASGSAADNIPSIKAAELKKLIENKTTDILVVDTQPKAAYDMGHIPGAVNFPWQEEIEGAVNLPRDKTLVIYCACAHEEDATDTAKQLTQKYGYRNVKVLEGGWIEWTKLGYPIEKQ